MNAEQSMDVPLCVDLDGTLLRTDMLFESLLTLVKQQPLCLLMVPLWLFHGKARLKAEIASRVDLSGGHFPFNEGVCDYVREARKHRRTVLVTGTHQSLAESVSNGHDLFDEVRGSDADVNLTSLRKRDWLVSRFGEQGFDYIGNDEDDLDVWPAAREALVVTRPGGLTAHGGQPFAHTFDMPARRVTDFLSLIRIHQWAKNGLILVPYFLDQRFNDGQATVAIVLAFLAMSLLASATYIVNDMLDLQADRQNATKSRRALASGRVSLRDGFIVIGFLALACTLVMTVLPFWFNVLLGVYLVATLTYSFLLKRKAVLDVISIAALHTLRVIAGTVAIQSEWSFWLLAFSMFIFFSLALAKRVAELLNLQQAGRVATIGRDYQVADIPVLMASGVSTGFLSILVVALYINGDKVLTLYSEPMLLWLVCPMLMYWVARIWIKTARGQMHEDPIVWAMRDHVSQLTVALLGLAVALAMVV